MAPPPLCLEVKEKKGHSRPKGEVVTFPTIDKNKNIFTKICTANVESLKVAGKIQEIIAYMRKSEISIFVGTECRAGFCIFASQEHVCLQSGDVVFILGPALARCWSHFVPFSERVASVDIRIRGGWATFIGVYFPYEKYTPENEQTRINVNMDVSEVLARVRHPGPRFLLGDLNTIFTYRNEDEHSVLGPFLFNPSPPLPSNYITNHALLVDTFKRAGMVLRSTFFRMSQLKRVTFYAKGSLPTHIYRTIFNTGDVEERDLYPLDLTSPPRDTTHYREIDHVLVGSKYANSVCKVKPDQFTRIGMSTHHPVIVSLKLPPVDRLKNSTSDRIPRLAWKDPVCLEAAREELRKAAAVFRRENSTVHLFDRYNFRPIPIEGFPETGIEISMDGGFTPASDEHPARASFSVVVLAGIPPRAEVELVSLPANTPREELANHPRVLPRTVLFKRYGPVVLTPTDPLFIGVDKLSSHSAELTAMVEALLILFVEGAHLLNRPILFTFDSKNAGNQTRGDWMIR